MGFLIKLFAKKQKTIEENKLINQAFSFEETRPSNDRMRLRLIGMSFFQHETTKFLFNKGYNVNKINSICDEICSYPNCMNISKKYQLDEMLPKTLTYISDKVHADSFKAFVGAMFVLNEHRARVDVKDFIEESFASLKGKEITNYKNIINDMFHDPKNRKSNYVFKTERENDKIFRSTLSIETGEWFGQGKTKIIAEQIASRAYLIEMGIEIPKII